MSEVDDLKISMIEATFADLDLECKSYGAVSSILKERGLVILYECSTRVLTSFQRSLFEKVLMKIPREIALFVDPIVVSFALKDACDFSGVDYIWFDLEGNNDMGRGAWMREKDVDDVINLAISLLSRHLETYLIDAYDRKMREDVIRSWEAGLRLLECPICGKASLERKAIAANNIKFRGWTCNCCGHHVFVPSDALDYLNRNVEGSG